MANHEINEEQEAVNKALRMIETSDPVHADVYNALFSVLINNDVFLEKLANKMVQQVMISHVMDSTNKDMVMGADQGPVITQLIEKVQEKVDVLNTKRQEIAVFKTSVSKNITAGSWGFWREKITIPSGYKVLYVSATFDNADQCMLTPYSGAVTAVGTSDSVEPYFGFFAHSTVTGTFTAYAVCIKK